MEQVYKDWQKSVIDNFYEKAKSKQISLPKDNRPLYACKDKITIVINFIENGTDNSTRVLNGDTTLPKKEQIKLYHIGEKKMNFTSNGVKDDEFIFPAIDTGGLTNYKQKMGKPNTFLPAKFVVNESTTQQTIDSIYKKWRKYSGKKRFYGNLKQEFTKAIRSIKQPAFIQFIVVPREYRVIVTQTDVYNKLNSYYLRNYAGPEYAKSAKPVKGAFCGIGEKNITPDINKNNILNEYKIC